MRNGDDAERAVKTDEVEGRNGYFFPLFSSGWRTVNICVRTVSKADAALKWGKRRTVLNGDCLSRQGKREDSVPAPKRVTGPRAHMGPGNRRKFGIWEPVDMHG